METCCRMTETRKPSGQISFSRSHKGWHDAKSTLHVQIALQSSVMYFCPGWYSFSLTKHGFEPVRMMYLNILRHY